MAIPFLDLPFDMEALAPHMSAKTLEFHYGKHYKSYVDSTNRLIRSSNYDSLDLEEIMIQAHNKDAKIYNVAAQAWNHNFFWNCLVPSSTPSANLLKVFRESFGGLASFKNEFEEVCIGLFGSGWVWLVRDGNNNLIIRALKDAGNPLLDGEIPIFTCDVWEHAYYLDYQNSRAEYLKNFWTIANWNFLESNLTKELPEAAQKRRPKGDLTTAREFNEARATHH